MKTILQGITDSKIIAHKTIPNIDRKWITVAKRRLAELRSGRVKPVPGKEVFAKVHEKIQKIKETGAYDDRIAVKKLFRNIVAELPALEELLAGCSDHWGYEDPVYRFYHQSFKVYHLQEQTQKIVEKLQALAPNRHLNEWFMDIVQEGTGKTFKMEDNDNWLVITRPIIEAFFHARFFLEMAVKYGKELKFPPRELPSGWAALLYLYDLRY